MRGTGKVTIGADGRFGDWLSGGVFLGKRSEPHLASGCNRPETSSAEQTVVVVRNRENGTCRAPGGGRPNGDGDIFGEWTQTRHVRGGAHTENESQERRTGEDRSRWTRGALKVPRSLGRTLSAVFTNSAEGSDAESPEGQPATEKVARDAVKAQRAAMRVIGWKHGCFGVCDFVPCLERRANATRAGVWRSRCKAGALDELSSTPNL